MSLKVKSGGIEKDLRLMTDVTTPPYASEDGSSFSNNFLLVNLTKKEDLCNMPAYFNYSSEQLKYGQVTELPTGTNLEQPFIGYREVFPVHVSPESTSHVVVKVTEYYPVLGREHYRFYNVTGWSSWKTINNT